MKATITKEDEVRAAGMGIQIDCPNCAASRDMDDLHRIQIGILRGELSESQDRYVKNLNGFADALDYQIKRTRHWKLGCFAGWLTVAFLIMGEIFGK